MSNILSFDSEQRRSDEASRWLARIDRTLSSTEERQLERWLAADDKNEQRLLEMAELWDNMEALKRLSSLFPRTMTAPPKPNPRRSLNYGIAATVFILVMAGGLFWQYPIANLPFFARAQEQVYQTAPGERSTLTLTDGSLLTLNTQSQVRLKYTKDYRLLTLLKGEMHIKVAKDASRPLSVKANNNVVQAVGTEFNVEITQQQQIELLVTEGKVRVTVQPITESDSDNAPPPRLTTAPAVSAGQQLIVDNTTKIEEVSTRITEITPEDLAVKLSWQNGNLIFRGEPLEDAIQEIGRYTEVEFIILDDALRKVRVAGFFKAGDVDSLLAVLKENFAITVQRENDNKVFLSRQH